MRKISMIALGLVCAMGAAPALASDAPMVYAYESKENYCPQGLQPIAMNGVICCGTPNQPQSWQQVMRHPVVKKKKAVKRVTYAPRARVACPVGEKGCY